MELIEKVKTDPIIKGYKDVYKIDVSHYFKDLNSIEIYKCKNTNYKFYYPNTIAGDGKFYEKLEGYDWYYPSEKWEYKATLKLINPKDKLLEIGCGIGYFLQKANAKSTEAVGLELNESAIRKAEALGLDVKLQTIEQHVKNKREYYDIVCSFQLMEHITDIKAVLRASVDALKVNGTLIICVPNNKAFIKNDKKNLLNMPPHHMGLWDDTSLTALTKIFPLKLSSIQYEPLQATNFSWFYLTFLQLHMQNRIIMRLIKTKPFYRLMMLWLRLFSRFYKGHSVLATYTKLK